MSAREEQDRVCKIKVGSADLSDGDTDSAEFVPLLGQYSDEDEVNPVLVINEANFDMVTKSTSKMTTIGITPDAATTANGANWHKTSKPTTTPTPKTVITVNPNINNNNSHNCNNNNNNSVNNNDTKDVLKNNSTNNKNNNSNNNNNRNHKMNTNSPAKSKKWTGEEFFRSKYFVWSWRLLRRKQVIGLLAAAFLYMVYTTMTAGETDVQEQIPVVHYSHVPGMKVAQNNSLKPLLQAQPPALVVKDKVSSSEMKSVAALASASAVQNISTTLGNSTNAFADDDQTTDTSTLIINTNSFNNSSLYSNFLYWQNNTNNNDVDAKNVQNFNIINEIKTTTTTTTTLSINASLLAPPPGYLVWSERCKMTNLDPYLPEVMKYFKREKYTPCSVQTPLTYTAYSEASQRYVLRVNEDVISSYSKSRTLDCCYQVIERNSTGINADKNVALSECISFKKSTRLAQHIDNILVKCRAKKKQVYINGHAMMPERKELRERLDAWRRNDAQHKRHRPPSVLMIGIDSISRTNLIRAMPKTAQFLYDNEWFEMSGYNKMDDNTFPNLMAVLAGFNKSHAYTKCSPTELNGLDNCDLIWRTFRDHGYVTAYGEDEASINTFNYLKVGFEHPPVDYYLRPFLLSAEKHLRVKQKSGLNFCLGYQHSADFVYEYAIELTSRYKNDPYFGLFWTNSFSHNAISDCTAMDEKMVEYLKRFSSLGAFENTIVIFFSDHGMRFGPTRSTYSGHLEERLPFLFIWLPQHLKHSNPEFVNALSVNKNRLTNPYDLHMTLKHILGMSKRVENSSLLRNAEDCPRCQTLLEPVPHNRSCEDAAIEDHWCTCIPYQNVYKDSKKVQSLAKAAVVYINQYVATFKNGSIAELCTPLHLNNVESAYRAQNTFDVAFGAHSNDSNGDVETYRLIFQTKPNKAIFEATVRFAGSAKLVNNPQIIVTGEISRLNSYSSDSECIGDGGAKKYCSCRKKKLF